MDLANRFVVILLALLVVFAAALVVLLAWAAGPESVDRLGDFVQYLDEHAEDAGSKVILSMGGLVVALLALIVVFVELAPPEAATVPVRDVQAGNAVLSTEAVARRVQEQVARVPHVTQSTATVAARGKGVEVSLELQVDPDTNLTDTSEAACQAVLEVVTSQLGVELAKLPQVKLHFAEARLAPEASPPSAGVGANPPFAEGESPGPQAG